MAQKISQMTEQTTASMTETGTSDFLGGYTATGGNANRKFSLSGLANYFLNKFKMTLGGSSQTVKSAIDALNSNTALLMRPDSSGTLSSGNANNVTQTGNWLITNTSAVENIPSGLTGWWLLNVDRTYHDNSGNVLLQKLYRMGDVDQGVYMRGLSGTTWSNWVKMPTRAEVDALSSNLQKSIYYTDAQVSSLGGLKACIQDAVTNSKVTDGVFLGDFTAGSRFLMIGMLYSTRQYGTILLYSFSDSASYRAKVSGGTVSLRRFTETDVS